MLMRLCGSDTYWFGHRKVLGLVCSVICVALGYDTDEVICGSEAYWFRLGRNLNPVISS